MKASVRPNADDRVFVSFGKWINTAELIREDLKVAKIEMNDREGNCPAFRSAIDIQHLRKNLLRKPNRRR
jgi:hypothetical protein